MSLIADQFIILWERKVSKAFYKMEKLRSIIALIILISLTHQAIQGDQGRGYVKNNLLIFQLAEISSLKS